MSWPPQLTYFVVSLSFTARQASWCTRLHRLMRARWWRQPETLALCFCRARRTPSPSRKWATRPPTRCWRCSTSTPTASECLLSVRSCARRPHTRFTEQERVAEEFKGSVCDILRFWRRNGNTKWLQFQSPPSGLASELRWPKHHPPSSSLVYLLTQVFTLIIKHAVRQLNCPRIVLIEWFYFHFMDYWHFRLSS